MEAGFSELHFLKIHLLREVICTQCKNSEEQIKYGTPHTILLPTTKVNSNALLFITSYVYDGLGNIFVYFLQP